MTDWMLSDTNPSAEERQGWWRRLPPPALAKDLISDPSRYQPPEGLLDALNAALVLGQPLLLTGEPGCGKTEAAHYLAWRLGLDAASQGREGDAARRFDVKSTTTAKDLFYGFDVIGRFYAAQTGDNVDPLRFVTLNALGQAIFEASTDHPAELSARFMPAMVSSPRRSVVLIDEIDKAPRDVPNDLLMELEKLRFYIPEIDRTIAAGADVRPIIVLTSNRERELPDAFLRRCIVFSVPFPDAEALQKIVHQRIEDVGNDIVSDAIALTEQMRAAPLRRKPGTAELLSFVAALKGVGIANKARIVLLPNWEQIARTTLLKSAHDHDAIPNAVMHRYLKA